MQKEYENKLLNSELPGSRSWLEETERLYAEVSQRVKALTDRHLRELARLKMNPAVEQALTAFMTELL